MRKFLLCSLFISLLSVAANGQSNVPPLIIMSGDGKDTLFVAQDVVVSYSPDSLHASIKHDDRYRLVFSLPFHGLRTDHLEAVWNIKGKSIYFHSNDTHDRFYSVEGDLEEMEFASSDAVLDLEAKTLLVKRVPGIYSGNALIVPPSHEILFSSSKMPLFEQAQIILNAFSRYHHFSCTKIAVASRHAYEVKGSTIYEYRHPLNGKVYKFSDVQTKMSSQIIQRGLHQDAVLVTEIAVNIPESLKFDLFKEKIFRGTATGTDSDPALTFTGELGTMKDGKMEWKPFEGKVGSGFKL